MDRDVPPVVKRITYWTGNWNPGREAISNEIAALRDAFGERNPVVALASGQRSQLDLRQRVVSLNGRRWLAYRALAAAIERTGDITHVFGSIDAWHPLRSLGRRPMVFTVVIPGPPLQSELYSRVTRFVAETEVLADKLVELGVNRQRITVIYPGVDLSRFSPSPFPPRRPLRLLFASTPADAREMEQRGIPLIVDLARLRPDVEIVMPWRRWGDEGLARAAIERLRLPPNVRVEWGDQVDMVSLYRSVHATVTAFADGYGKSCPNSVIEGMACGRPALMTDTCGLASDLVAGPATVVVSRTAEDLAAGVAVLSEDLAHRGDAARQVSSALFDLAGFREKYRRVYEAVTDDGQ